MAGTGTEPSAIQTQSGHKWRQGLLLAGMLLFLVLTGFGLAGPLMTWPMVDEANYLLQAREISEGLLPYRDFYEFITPGGQLIGAVFTHFYGFSILGLRLLVMSGWLLEICLLCKMAGKHLPRPWLVLLAVFLWLTDSRYPVYQHHFWSGLTALAATYCLFLYLRDYYAGRKRVGPLVASGVLTGATFWITQSLGLAIAAALGLFGLLHCLLREREEKGLTFRTACNPAMFRHWLDTWGPTWLLPMLAVHVVAIATLMGLGIWDDFLRDSVRWLGGGHYAQTTVLGYFPTFHEEFIQTVKPFIDQVPMPQLLVYIFRIPIAFHLFLIGLLPAVGIIGTGYNLSGRFLYRLLRRQDEELLLYWLGATAMILSTMTYATSMHIVSNGGLGYLLGFLTVATWLQSRPRRDWEMRWITGVFCGLLLLGAVVGSGVQLLFGSWLPRFPGLDTNLIYTEYPTRADQVVTIADFLQEATRQGRSIFVFNESPSFYLTGHYRNATRFTLIIPLYTTSEQMQEILSDLERNSPLYILDDQTAQYYGQDVRFSRYRPDQLRLPELERYIHEHYSLQAALGRYRLYRRSEYFN